MPSEIDQSGMLLFISAGCVGLSLRSALNSVAVSGKSLKILMAFFIIGVILNCSFWFRSELLEYVVGDEAGRKVKIYSIILGIFNIFL
jgi:hypothetical protein